MVTEETKLLASLSTSKTPTLASMTGKPYSSLDPGSANLGTYKTNNPTFAGFTAGKEYQQEGIYRNAGDYEATLGDVTHKGTLYVSDLGSWELIDQKHQLIMSGSAGSTPTALKPLGAAPSTQQTTTPPTSYKTQETERTLTPLDVATGQSVWNPASSDVSTFKTTPVQTKQALTENIGWGYGGLPGKSSISALQNNMRGDTYRIGEYTVDSKAGTVKDASGRLVSMGTKTTPTPKGDDGLVSRLFSGLSTLFGSSRSQPTTQRASTSTFPSAASFTNPFTTGYKDIGEYRQYANGTIVNRQTNQRYNATTNTWEDIGGFGRKRGNRMAQHKGQCRKQSAGFVGAITETNQDLKAVSKTKKTRGSKKLTVSDGLWSGISYGGQKRTVPKKIDTSGKSVVKSPSVKLPTVTKPAKKEKYASAWEKVMFDNKPAKKTSTKTRK